MQRNLKAEMDKSCQLLYCQVLYIMPLIAAGPWQDGRAEI